MHCFDPLFSTSRAMMMKTLMMIRPPLKLLLFLAFTRSVSCLGSSLRSTNLTTTAYPIVVSAILSRSNWHQHDWIGKIKELDVLGTKLLRNSTTTKQQQQQHGDDDKPIQVHILLHDDHDRQILTDLLGGIADYEVIVAHNHHDDGDDDDEEEEGQENLRHRNLQQKQYETINKSPYKCYRTVKGTLDTMQDLATNYATLVKSLDIGQSYEHTVGQEEEGYPIRALRITGPSVDDDEDDVVPPGDVFRRRKKKKMMKKRRTTKKKAPILIVAGVHAREYGPPELLTRFAEKLATSYGTDADITWILDRTEVHLVPMANPDGRRIAQLDRDLSWRKNTNPRDGCGRSSNMYGVDLNRQFPFGWGDDSGSSGDPCAEQFRGPEALSEPETWALAEYAASIFAKEQRRGETYDQSFNNQNNACSNGSVGVFIDIHSYGGQVFYPWGFGDVVSPNNAGLRSMATKLASFGGYGLWGPGQPDFLYPVSGDTVDFMYGHHCASSVGFEIGTEFYEACKTFQEVVVPDTMPALILAAKIASAPFAIVKGPDVLKMTATVKGGGGAASVTVTATVSDSARATAYDVIDDTGLQNINSVCTYIDVHPYDATEPCIKMIPVDGAFDSTTEAVRTTIDNIAPGRHTVFIEARDALGYKGPVSAVFVEVPGV